MTDDLRDARALERFVGRWETSPDGREWSLDFQLTYRRVRGGGEG